MPTLTPVEGNPHEVEDAGFAPYVAPGETQPTPNVTLSDSGFLPYTGPGAEAAEPKSLLGQALTPFTSYPETYSQMNRESREQLGEGVAQAAEGVRTLARGERPALGPFPVDSPAGFDVLKGAGKAALGATGYVASRRRSRSSTEGAASRRKPST
jgi:hypothetical protein